MKRQKVYTHIEEHEDEHIEKVCNYIRQPSVSAQDYGIRECAELLCQYHRDLGCKEVELVETDGHPGVWAYFDAGADATIAIYCLYDVQPVDEKNWHYPPFGATITEIKPFGRVVVGRGALNTKGPYINWLNAMESIIAIEGNLPVNVMFILEGEEEIGSPHFHQIVERYKDRLKSAVAVFGPNPNQDESGRAMMELGNKGMVNLELECSGKNWGKGPKVSFIHSSFKSVVDSPVLRLIHALDTMTSDDGNSVLIEGFYDNVKSPSKEEKELIERLKEDFDINIWKKLYKVGTWIDNINGENWLLKYLYTPTLNIGGIWGGYTGTGPRTVLPHKANCKIDIRTVPFQKSDNMIPLVRSHLDKHGFEDIQIKKHSSYDWYRTDPRHPIVDTVVKIYNQYEVKTDIWPWVASSSPMYLFTRLDLPVIWFGLGHGKYLHAPDEYLVIDGNERVAGLVDTEKSIVDLLYNIEVNSRNI